MKYYENFNLEDIEHIDKNGRKSIEEWKDVFEFEGFYKISDLGRIKSVTRIIKNRTYPSQILVRTYNGKGYAGIVLTKGKTRKFCRINRLVAIAFLPNHDNKPEVNHVRNELGVIDKADNRAIYLEWNTGEENRNNALKEGLIRKGEQLHNSKLTEQQVLEIRENKNNLSHREFGVKYGVSKTNITSIRNNKMWKHLP